MGAFIAEKSVATPGRASFHGRTNGTALPRVDRASRTKAIHRTFIERQEKRSDSKEKNLRGTASISSGQGPHAIGICECAIADGFRGPVQPHVPIVKEIVETLRMQAVRKRAIGVVGRGDSGDARRLNAVFVRPAWRRGA